MMEGGMNCAITPQKRSAASNSTTQQTPRRSARKSVMPLQDYDQIVNCQGRQLRSAAKQQQQVADTIVGENEDVVEKVKWTPAKVGRVSEKRGRKGRKTTRQASTHESFAKQAKEFEDLGIRLIGDEEPEDKVDETIELVEVDKKQPADKSMNVDVKELLSDDKENPEDVVKEIAVVSELAGDNKQQPDVDQAINDDVVNDVKIEEKYNIVEENATSVIQLDNEDKEEEKVDPVEVDENQVEEKAAVENVAVNETFNLSDCFILSPIAVEFEATKIDELNHSNDDMEPLHISIDDAQNIASSPIAEMPSIVQHNASSPIVEKPTIVVTDAKTVEEELKDLREVTAKVDAPKLFETLTPLKVIAMEPVDIVLHSIRKRSLSLCIGDPNKTREKMRRTVRFHSPLNQTTVIDDLDKLIAENIRSESKVLKRSEVEQENIEESASQRRRRSLSFSDASLLASKPIVNRQATPRKLQKTPIKGSNTPSKGANTTGVGVAVKRTKMPNFSAIHEKQFDKMESLVEHVARKAERAKIISSATKNYPGKTTPSQVLQQERAITPNNKITRRVEARERIKAKKQIEWITPKRNTVTTDEQKVKRMAYIKPLPSKPVVVASGNASKHNQSQLKPVNVVSSVVSAKKPTLKTAAMSDMKLNGHNNYSNNKKVEEKKLAISKTTKTEFNAPTTTLSTSIAANAQDTKLISQSVSALPSTIPTASTTSLAAAKEHDKITSRRQRHMDMYKGRSASTRKPDEVLRGVRSNRRFELQMQHRRNMEQK